MKIRILLLSVCVLLASALTGCDDDATTPPIEVTITSVSPAAGASGVAVDQTITVVFSVDMDPTTAAANLTVTPGGVTDLTWTDARTLTITHPVWAEGATITVTVGAGFATADGETLAEPLTFSFTIRSDAPLVVQVDPSVDDSGVGLDEEVTVIFSEAMDPSSAAGEVTLSSGPYTSLDWLDSRTLEIDHADWPQGETVTVTLGTGLTDAGGTPLDAEFSWSFTTVTDAVALVRHQPSAGATDVPTNTRVVLEFNREMDGATLPGAILVTTDDLPKMEHPYTLDGDDEDWTLTFTNLLPASTDVTVTIGTGAEAWDGTPLGSETAFTFSTGAGSDDTPPQLVSAEPASGSTITAGTGFLRFTFDEPIDEDAFSPARMSGQFARFFWTEYGVEPVWSENYSVVTVALPTPLPAGAPLQVAFDSFADLAGNVNTDGLVWEVTVDGEPDHYPLEDGLAFLFLGSERPPTSRQMETWEEEELLLDQGGGVFHRLNRDSYSDSWDEWDMLRRDPEALLFLGFHETEDDSEFDVEFSPAIPWLPYPLVEGEWSGTSTFNSPLGGPDSVDYTGTVLPGLHDVLSPGFRWKQEDDEEVWWVDCRKVVLEYTLYDATETYSTGVDTLWYAPAVGLVREVSREQEPGEPAWHGEKTLYWTGLVTPER